MTENEAWYDTEIAPALAALNKKCAEKKMGFLAVVEFDPGSRGRTQSLPADAGVEMHMLYLCACAGNNFDKFAILMRQYAEKRGIDVSDSYYLGKL